MADFFKAYTPVKAWEGGWCDVPGDSGGETYAGIARNFWPNWFGWPLIDKAKAHSSFREGAGAFSRHLASLPGLDGMVTAFYRAEWWDRLGIENLPQGLADEIFEQAVNLGIGGAGKQLQRLCNALNYSRDSRRPLFDDLVVDGVPGPKTMQTLEILLRERRALKPLVYGLNCLQAAHYISLAARRPEMRKFLDGWLTRTSSKPRE